MWFSAPTFPLVSNELFRQPIVDTSEYLVYLKFSAHLLYDLDQIFISDSFSTKAQACHGNLPGFLPWKHPYALRIFQHITCWKKNIDLQLNHVPSSWTPTSGPISQSFRCPNKKPHPSTQPTWVSPSIYLSTSASE